MADGCAALHTSIFDSLAEAGCPSLVHRNGIPREVCEATASLMPAKVFRAGLQPLHSHFRSQDVFIKLAGWFFFCSAIQCIVGGPFVSGRDEDGITLLSIF